MEISTNLKKPAGKLLVVGGLTSSGKTKSAINLAKKFSGVIISCDSRQVYKHFDIGTGKLSGLKDYKKIETSGRVIYETDGVKIHGYDLCEADEKINSFDFSVFARSQIEETWSCGKLPILVGGTGLYIKMILNGAQFAAAEPGLRSTLSVMSVEQLTQILLSENPDGYNLLNQSDRQNPTRLVRAIEKTRSKTSVTLKPLSCDLLYLYFKYPREYYEEVIEKSIQDRLDEGFMKEAVGLISYADLPAGTAIGYKEAFLHLKGEIDWESFLNTWRKNEISYVKRQATWFKAQSNTPFDVKSENFNLELEKTVAKWLQ